MNNYVDRACNFTSNDDLLWWRPGSRPLYVIATDLDMVCFARIQTGYIEWINQRNFAWRAVYVRLLAPAHIETQNISVASILRNFSPRNRYWCPSIWYKLDILGRLVRSWNFTWIINLKWNDIDLFLIGLDSLHNASILPKALITWHMGAMAVNNTGNLVRTLPMNYCDSVDDSARSLQPKWIAVETREAQLRLFLWPRWGLARSKMSLFSENPSLSQWSD